ncbi:MAG TPA: hypothetical protein DCO86_00935, partial [Spirochaetaceae bacterium]|nr:hypothetical protein [Spirochaetaceae bacterium]
KERFRNGFANDQAGRQGLSDTIIAVSQPEPVCVVCGKKIAQIETSIVAKKFFPDYSDNSDNDNSDDSHNSELPASPSEMPLKPNGCNENDNLKSLCHFDCAIRYIRESRQLKPPYRISYIGSGNFAIFKYGKNKSEFAFVEKIEFESRDDFKAMQEYVQGLVK